MLTPVEVESLWESMFPEVRPEADQLKWVFPSRWVRFHSLPGSKRYPDGPQEEALILSRHNAVLKEVWPPGTSIVIIQTIFSFSEKTMPEPDASGWTCWHAFAADPAEADTVWWHLFYMVKDWQEGILDELILKTAHEWVTNLMVVDVEGRVLYHPYDGGMDLICTEIHQVSKLRSRFSSWLSPLSSGL
jgi:hypothetical protein